MTSNTVPVHLSLSPSVYDELKKRAIKEKMELPEYIETMLNLSVYFAMKKGNVK